MRLAMGGILSYELLLAPNEKFAKGECRFTLDNGRWCWRTALGGRRSLLRCGLLASKLLEKELQLWILLHFPKLPVQSTPTHFE
jgi:hypothetical protein